MGLVEDFEVSQRLFEAVLGINVSLAQARFNAHFHMNAVSTPMSLSFHEAQQVAKVGQRFNAHIMLAAT